MSTKLLPIEPKDALRFWRHVDEIIVCSYESNGVVSNVNPCGFEPVGCNSFYGYLNPKGYGEFKLNGRKVKAHRVAYALYYGKEPGELLGHSCENRDCCNPLHLENETIAESNRKVNLKRRVK
jgi:hypothetical protein